MLQIMWSRGIVRLSAIAWYRSYKSVKNILQKCHNQRYKLLLFSIITLFISCNTSNNQEINNVHKEPSYFTYNRFDGIASLDPAFARNQGTTWACHHLYNGLVQLDKDLTIKPAIAKSWEIDETGTIYTFKIRDDIYFHEHKLFSSLADRKVKAKDVAFSLDRIIDPKVASTGGWLFNDKVVSENPFVAINDSTFQLTLQKPFNPILGILSMQYCSIVPQKIVEYYGKDFRANPVGTGPFKFQLWQEGEVLLLAKNNDYFDIDNQGVRIPYLDGIRIEFIIDKGLEYIKFKQGELDYISDIDPAFRNDLLTKDGELHADLKNEVQLIKAPYLNTEYMGFLLNTGNALQQKNLRLAINYGIDRPKMLQFIRNNVGTPAIHGMVPRGMPGFDHNQVIGFSFNPEKAKEYLVKAGYPNGKGLEPITITTIDSYVDWAVSMQNQLAEIGIPIKIELVQSAFLREMMRKSEGLEIFRASWIADYTDPENYLSLFYGKNGAPPNYTRFKNASFDKLYEQSVVEIDPSIRQALYEQMDQVIVNEAPVIPLYYDELLSFSKPHITGLFSHPMNILDLRYVKKE